MSVTRFEAENVVLAMANYQKPRRPIFAKDLNPCIRQLDAHTYRNPSQLQKGGVVVVGVGNSGADIAIEAAATRPTWLSGRESGHIPYRIESFMARFVFVRIIRLVGHHILSLRTPIGGKQRPKFLHRAAPLIRVKPQDFAAAGIQRVGKMVGVKGGLPLLEHVTKYGSAETSPPSGRSRSATSDFLLYVNLWSASTRLFQTIVPEGVSYQ